MILVRSSFVLGHPSSGRGILRNIEAAGRTCYKSTAKEEDPEAFVRNLLKLGHESVIEHVSFTVLFVVDRGVSHELVRHRLAAYSQESTRYVDYSGKKTSGHCHFVIPPWLPEIPEGEAFDADVEHRDISVLHVGGRKKPVPAIEVATPTGYRWLLAMASAERDYKALRADGWAPQQARSVLPNSTKTEIVMTANAREWRHVLRLRTAKAAHPQMREVMVPLLATMKDLVPALFDDIETPEA